MAPRHPYHLDLEVQKVLTAHTILEAALTLDHILHERIEAEGLKGKDTVL